MNDNEKLEFINNHPKITYGLAPARIESVFYNEGSLMLAVSSFKIDYDDYYKHPVEFMEYGKNYTEALDKLYKSVYEKFGNYVLDCNTRLIAKKELYQDVIDKLNLEIKKLEHDIEINDCV